MECRDWNERISAYVDGETPAGEVRLVEEHLKGCAACRALELRMRAVALCVSRTEADVPLLFREKLFARMESEDLLAKRRSLFAYSLRWAAIPLAAAAALAFFLLTSTERGGDRQAPSGGNPQVAQRAPANETTTRPSPAAPGGAGELTSEEREIVAHLDVLEDPSAFEDTGEFDEIEIFVPAGSGKG
ncbi:MAG: zf-HC2 domain-containing protein [Deltaproteobacteria bacterium]|nr:zf-HC2 domain-containing protein [Deltaproteobacteria bacterium]